MSLVACECLPSPGLEPEPCSRARSQARVYLEQIRNRVALGASDVTKRDYLVDAATQIRLALERDVGEDYEAAFNHYQNGVDVLLRGIHVDPNKERREAVKLKITKYLRRAEEIFNCHLQRPLGSGASPSTGFSSLRLRPIRTLSSAVEQLRGCRVVGVIEKVQLVQDPATGGTFVVKSLPRCHMVSRERLTIIPHGVPYMTKLLRYFVSEDSIFLHLEHVQGGCGRGTDQSCLSADGAGRGCGRATWSVREEQVKQWAAEMLVALEALHEQGVLCRDLHPGNLLLDQAGHIRLTYFGQWSEVEPQCCGEAMDNLYSAPEVGGISELTEACDWWSFGSLLYELLTGMALSQSHPSGIQAHTQLQLPEWLSRPAASLLTELLQFEPTRRLGVGEGGVSKLKSHPFFSTIQWSKLVG
ncbi:ribosomal protein S6 kinase-like 1 isoform X2 [Macaca thibetana thibetana]|uniref:ribosomal protein S6 kinase-like 1 isoform X2 n=1 Tax=Macaca thibetana thibetana TaxID=257877 RepID=UPI0021BC4257|nr:ribosomal protein S6 kinase-like 1 isoform X2 [Macaca thibetana thibetana]